LNRATLVFGWIAVCLLSPAFAQEKDTCEESVTAKLRVDTGNPWRPPFGLERVGAPPVVHVELETAQPLQREYSVVAYRDGQEAERKPVKLEPNPTGGVWGKVTAGDSVLFGRVELAGVPDEVALIARCEGDGRITEVARQRVEWPEIEADAAARPDRIINPVDLGAILVPHDRLLLAGGQRARIEFAAMSRKTSFPDTTLKIWFDDGAPTEMGLPVPRDRRVVKQLELRTAPARAGSVLHVALVDGGRELWRKDIPTMVITDPPEVPSFGAIETKLRYDVSTDAGSKSPDDDNAWDPRLNDVVVFLPNGSRFVFWRRFHYAPFWASPNNTGFNYEWAENLTHPFDHPDWGTLFPEPLFDKELRYGRVRIMESTSSRVHVRWSYEGTDPTYRRWGEQVAEDYYFYTDGFGTRVMTLVSAPDAAYEVSEFIILIPEGAYPFEVLPEKMIEMLYIDGQRRDIRLPRLDGNWRRYGNVLFEVPDLRDLPAIYRIFQEKDDKASAIFFNPRHVPKTAYVFQHRYMEGEATGPALGWRGESGHGYSSLWTAIKDLPEPISVSTYPMIDALGHSKEMMIRRWAWLIAKTDAPDAELFEWAQSYSAPPSIEVSGAHIDFPSYVPERRAMRLIAESHSIEIKMRPSTHCVNPVFELAGASRELVGVSIDGVPLASDDFAWDGATLWVKASIDERGATIGLQFR
jgi:hypothetical protein